MNYTRHYELLIEKARLRDLDGYFEKHHIVPKCMGGNNSLNNLVNLTAREHFIAHRLLCKIYPSNKKLFYAIHLMCIANNGVKISSRTYEWIRELNSTIRTGEVRPDDTRSKISAALLGKSKSPEHRENLKKAGTQFSEGHTPWNKGKKCPGRVLSEDHKRSISDSLLGMKKSVSQIKKMVDTKRENGTTCKDYKWYNNGSVHIRCKFDDIIPDGFVLGRIYKKRRRKDSNNDE